MNAETEAVYDDLQMEAAKRMRKLLRGIERAKWDGSDTAELEAKADRLGYLINYICDRVFRYERSVK